MSTKACTSILYGVQSHEYNLYRDTVYISEGNVHVCTNLLHTCSHTMVEKLVHFQDCECKGAMGAGLAASIDMVGVSLGGILGHAIVTGVAVLGGRQLAAHIREKTVAV